MARTESEWGFGGGLNRPNEGNMAPSQCQVKSRNISVLLRIWTGNEFAETAAIVFAQLEFQGASSCSVECPRSF